MSRIYHNTSLKNKPVHNEKYDSVWSPSSQESGPGVILEGTLVDVSRHALTDVNNQKALLQSSHFFCYKLTPAPHQRREGLCGPHRKKFGDPCPKTTQSKSMQTEDSILFRYHVLYIKPRRIHRRKYDANGKEIEPNFSDTRKVNTGFLMSSYKVEAKGESDSLSEEQLSALIRKADLVKITDKHRSDGTWAFWYPECEMEKTELETETDIRLKTRGNSPFIFSLAKIEGRTVSKCNFAGDEKTGASWTDKIMANKSGANNIQKPCGEGEGSQDDEWND
ncbi:arpin isoform X2 [Corythoichthys intestinalis]|uniref:arpin isoform X2 n=1 Tax=Corythoichthys intestinalis TaxID=161448 RepID=UPI0025A66514|nr:arpin isoform X2 [Corythoichthys intestinalis]